MRLSRFVEFGRKIICVGRNYRPAKSMVQETRSLIYQLAEVLRLLRDAFRTPERKERAEQALSSRFQMPNDIVAMFVEDMTQLFRRAYPLMPEDKEHAEELGHAVPKEPLLFMKPPTAYITEGQSIMIPRDCEELDHEVELGVVVGRRGSSIRAEEALDYVAGYVVALDMTDRQLQKQCQAQGHPWERAKGFDTSCPVGQFLPKESVSDPHALTLWCKVNGQQRQKGSTSHMLFTIQQLLEAASARFTLEPGDLLLTGTPSGVGPVRAGDVVEAGIEGLGQVRFPVEQQKPKQ